MRKQSGFTIIELLLATTFFSFILIMVTAGFVQINRSYTRGTIVRGMQNNGRVLFEDISRNIRESSPGSMQTVVNAGSPATYRLCLNGVRYGWDQFNGSTRTTSLGSGPNVPSLLKIYDSANCNGTIPTSGAQAATSPLGTNIIVQHLSAEFITPDKRSVRLLMVISSPTAELVPGSEGKDARCRPERNSQYCDVVRFESVISLRNND